MYGIYTCRTTGGSELPPQRPSWQQINTFSTSARPAGGGSLGRLYQAGAAVFFGRNRDGGGFCFALLHVNCRRRRRRRCRRRSPCPSGPSSRHVMSSLGFQANKSGSDRQRGKGHHLPLYFAGSN